MTLSELVRTIENFAEIAVTILLAYAVYKIATLIDVLIWKIKREKAE
ncbi:MAG: hypothetical protein ACP5JW_02325 [Candidatus Bathyarchaeia archaeon]